MPEFTIRKGQLAEAKRAASISLCEQNAAGINPASKMPPVCKIVVTFAFEDLTNDCLRTARKKGGSTLN